MKPMITVRWWLWTFGLGFSRGLLTTYSCGQTQGDPGEFYLHFGPFEFFWVHSFLIRRQTSEKRYSDDFF